MKITLFQPFAMGKEGTDAKKSVEGVCQIYGKMAARVQALFLAENTKEEET